MTNIGIVRSVEGNMAKVCVTAGPGYCETCHHRDVCDIETGGIEAVNLVNAKVGQKVRINIKTLTRLKEVLVMYLLPIVALLTGAVLGRSYLPAYFRGTSPDVLSAAAGFFLFLITLLTARLFSRKMEKKTEKKPVIESIIEE
ncbi:MAG: SoxR reducing system RseC family protein [Thermodesulfovibrionales bacterium]